MPYEIREMDGEYCVCTPGDGPIEGGCHATEEAARDHMAALYANVEDASPSQYGRLRLNLISEVALAADGAARPIHILRTGTFTDGIGRAHTYGGTHLQQLLTNFSAGKRKRPPITERHDFGRAVGRIEQVWTDGTNLYALPKWNKTGQQLLADEVYDGFSCEIDRTEDGLILIGGSLTNYPAVDGLEPVTLSAPPIEAPSSSLPPPMAPTAPVDRPLTQETRPMSEPMEQAALPGVPPTTTGATPSPVASPPPLPPITDAALQARLDAYLAQNQAYIQQRERQIEASVRAEFDRSMRELEQRSQIESFARNMTMTTAEQPYALSCPPTELYALLLETPATVRSKWMTLISRVVKGDGLVSFDEIGSSGDAEVADRRETLISQKVAAGISRVEAIRAVDRENPDLYNAQARAKRGGR